MLATMLKGPPNMDHRDREGDGGVGRAEGRAGLLPPSEEGLQGGNLPHHVPGGQCAICTHIHDSCKHALAHM